MPPPIIDHVTIEECYFGDRDLLGEVVAVFLGNKDAQLAAIAAAVAARDPDAVERAAHRFKGGLLTIGAAAAAEAARVLEQEGRDGVLDGVDAAHQTLRAEIARLLPALAAALA